ncbi:MAG: type II toxin-antitoxin system Phd/YefM family antitoxin [Chloroflexota bacterium]|nr:MAG: type II toxin-antitoxin system Phd/YefM family antitoxin [Chloroflexota bacterium]
MKTVGAYEAKTHLARLLDDVSNGEVVTITRHGVPVAKLVPAEEPQSMTRREVIEALKAFGRGRTLEGVTNKEMIEDGRRY